jgi:hypothetical protein
VDPLKTRIAGLVKERVRVSVLDALKEAYPGAEIRVDTADNLVATVMIRAKDCPHSDLRFMGTRHFQVKISEVL